VRRPSTTLIMAVNPPSFILKTIWIVHFVLSSWALLSGFLNGSYLYTHLGVLACGLYAILSAESTDAVVMFLATLLFSILNDIILLSLYEPRGHNLYEQLGVSTSARNEYRFALGMCITNLILKPVSAFILYRIYQSRASGSDFDSGIPGLNTSRFGGGNRQHYDNIESTQGPTLPYGRPSEPPQYQAPGYQEPPPMGTPGSGKA
jgi:hypothetical protein